jgi:hypothetical protein
MSSNADNAVNADNADSALNAVNVVKADNVVWLEPSSRGFALVLGVVGVVGVLNRCPKKAISSRFSVR